MMAVQHYRPHVNACDQTRGVFRGVCLFRTIKHILEDAIMHISVTMTIIERD